MHSYKTCVCDRKVHQNMQIFFAHREFFFIKMGGGGTHFLPSIKYFFLYRHVRAFFGVKSPDCKMRRQIILISLPLSLSFLSFPFFIYIFRSLDIFFFPSLFLFLFLSSLFQFFYSSLFLFISFFYVSY